MYDFKKSPIAGLKVSIKDRRDAEAKAWWAMRKKIGAEPTRKIWAAVDRVLKKTIDEFYKEGSSKEGLASLLKEN